MKSITLALLLMLLSVSFAHAVGKGVKPPHHGVSAFGFTTIEVDMTDADVPASQVSAVTAAVKDPVNKGRRLFALTRDAADKGRTFVVTDGLRVLSFPRGNGGFFPRDGDKLSPPKTFRGAFPTFMCNPLVPLTALNQTRVEYSLHQTLTLASRLNPEGTTTVDITIQESPTKMSGKGSFPIAGYAGISTRSDETFHDGETKVLGEPSRGDGICHLIFATVTILPPRKK